MAAVYVFHVKPKLAPGGYLAVDVFFVLSGYVITRVLLSEHRKTGAISLPVFYRRRWLRLMPALVAMLVFATAASLALNLVPHGLLGDVVASATYLMDFRHPWSDHQSPFGHTWSLAIEEQFYFVWPLLLVLLLRGRRLLVPTLAALVVALTVLRVVLDGPVAPLTIRYTPLGHADQLLLGALLAAVTIPAWLGRWRCWQPHCWSLYCHYCQCARPPQPAVLAREWSA